MTSPTLEHDPDVLQAIEDLGSNPARLRMIEADILLTDETLQHRKYMGLRAAAGQCRDAIKLRAERLGVRPDALAHLLNEEARLRTRAGRKPTRSALRRVLADGQDHAAEALRKATVRARVAQVALQQAERAAEASRGALAAYEGRPAA